MATFLSDDWVQAFDAALRADADLRERFAASPIAIAQEVSTGAVEPVRYVVVLDGDGGRVETGGDGPVPDVTFVCDRATAVSLAQGTVNAQGALTSGRLKIRGEVDRLAAASGALAALGDLLADLRKHTEY